MFTVINANAYRVFRNSENRNEQKGWQLVKKYTQQLNEYHI